MGEKKAPDSQNSSNRFPGGFLARPELRDECWSHVPSAFFICGCSRGVDPVNLTPVCATPACVRALTGHTQGGRLVPSFTSRASLVPETRAREGKSSLYLLTHSPTVLKEVEQREGGHA